MTKRTLTIADIRSKYTEEKKLADENDIWRYFILRRISFYPTWLFLRLGISANRITYVSFAIGLVGCSFLALGSYWAAIVGALLMNVWFLFDLIDGNVARYTNTCTKYGEYIDGMTGRIIYILMYIAIGIGVFNHPDPYLNSLFNSLFGINVNNNLYLILGVMSSFLWIFSYLATDSMGLVFSIKPVSFYKPEVGSKMSLWGIIYTVGVGLRSIIKPLLLVAAIAHVLSIFVLLLALLNTAYFITVTTRALTEAKKVGGVPHE